MEKKMETTIQGFKGGHRGLPGTKLSIAANTFPLALSGRGWRHAAVG